MCADIKSSHDFLYSKHQKCLEEISKFWKSQSDLYNKRSNEGTDMDSQDERYHGVQPMDPNVMAYKKKNKVGVIMWLGAWGHGDAQCPGGTLIGSDGGLCMLLR